jgi:hypothetical protein
MAVLQPVFEAEDAMMLMDYLHTDVATKADIARLEDRMSERFNGLEHSVETQIASAKHEMLAAFRGELIDAVSGQTRALIFTSAASVASMGGIAVALARFA